MSNGQQQALPDGGFLLRFTPLGARMMIGYVALWAALVAITTLVPERLLPLRVSVDVGPPGFEVPTSFEFWRLLLLHPPGAGGTGPGFHWWQLITAPFVYPPGPPGGLFMAALCFGFFGAGVEQYLGRREFVKLWGVASAGAILGGLLLAPLQRHGLAHWGFGPAALACLVVYCMATPNAIVPIFLVVPVKMKWIAAAAAVFVLIRTLALTAPVGGGAGAGGYELGGVAAGFLWWRYGDELDPRRWRRKRKARRLLRAVEDSIENGLPEEDDEPIFH